MEAIPATAVEFLTENYTGASFLHEFLHQTGFCTVFSSFQCDDLSAVALAGYAQMASLVVQWTNELQDEEGAPEQPAELDEAHYLRVGHQPPARPEPARRVDRPCADEQRCMPLPAGAGQEALRPGKILRHLHRRWRRAAAVAGRRQRPPR